jgi:hypothetical protein
MWKYTHTDEMYHSLTSQNELYHYGILGMKWGVRRHRDSSGNLTRYGAKSLAKQYNKLEKTKDYVAVKYKDVSKKKNHMVYKLDTSDKRYIEAQARVNAILSGPIGSTIITNHQLNNRLSKKFDNPNGIGPRFDEPIDYKTIVKTEKKKKKKK